jgi:hypothetical protein
MGVSLLLLPFYGLSSLLTGDGSRLIVLYGPLVTALSARTLFRLVRELGASASRAVAVAFTFAFGTLAWHYSTTILQRVSGRPSNDGRDLLAPRLSARCAATLATRGRRGNGDNAARSLGLGAAHRHPDHDLCALPDVRVRRASSIVARLVGYGAPLGAVLAVNLWYDWLRNEPADRTPALLRTLERVG